MESNSVCYDIRVINKIGRLRSQSLICLITSMFTDYNYNKILKSDWLSTVLISALIGQCNRTVRVMPK